jgi:prophage regulatory protein
VKTRRYIEVHQLFRREKKIMNERILRRKQVEHRTGLSRSTIYLRIKQGTFPRPVGLGPRAVGWLENEIDAWLAACIENRHPLTVRENRAEVRRVREDG